MNDNKVMKHSAFIMTLLDNLLTAPTGFARRALLLLSVLMMSVGNVRGAETELTITYDNGCMTVSAAQFSTATTSSVLRIYETADAKLYVADIDWWGAIFDYFASGENKYKPIGQYWDSSKSCAELPLRTASIVSILQARGLRVKAEGGQTISKITLENPAADEFLGSEASGATTEKGSKQIEDKSATTANFDLSGVSLTGIKYARIYVADASGNALSDQSSLSVSYDGTAAKKAGTADKNGVYVYNAGVELDKSKFSITLNASAGAYPNYKVICLLSTSAGTPAAGPLTKEPDWNLTYTFSFTYPVEIISLDDKITVSDLEKDQISLDIQTGMLTKFAKTAEEVKGSWYTSWSVENNAGDRQPLSNGWSNTTIFRVAGANIQDNAAFMQYNDGKDVWYFTNNAGKVTFNLPSGKKLSDFTGYNFVCETSDQYDGTTASPTFIFKIPIPSPVTFEYDGTIANTTAVTQLLESRTSTTSVTLDNNQITISSIKYVRFYVVDGAGTAVSPTDAAHQLTVSGGTLCTQATSGYYYYTGSEITTLPTVTLTSTGDVRDYRVVCWLATSETNISTEGTTVSKEPDINWQYTFSFKKPSVSSTEEKAASIAWSSTSMTADATSGAPTDWNTSWSDLAKVQYVKWYVVGTDGTTKQPLALGSGRQNDTWTIGLAGTPFTVSENVAVLTGQTKFAAENWNTWGKPAIYAPGNKAYADVYNYKVICEVSEEASASATPNVRYTFSFTKDFPGSGKSTIEESSKHVILTGGTTSLTLTEVELPTGTKYARFYLTNSGGVVVSPTGKLTVSDSKTVKSTITGYENYGFYLYSESGISSAPTVTLTLPDATLNAYRVVMVTSADKAVVDGGDVVSEPDYDTRKTWTFKYPATHVLKTGNVEWNPVSMTPDFDIDGLKGTTGYLSSLGTSYHVVWTVEDGSGTKQALTTGSHRQSGTWTVSRSGNNAAFFAPTGQTYDGVKDLKFVARLYESVTGEDATDLALTYTVSIHKTGFKGSLKDGGVRGEETVEGIDESATAVTVPLGDASSVFSGTAKYARVWLTRNGTVINPGILSVSGGTPFTGTKSDYGFYLTNDGGVSLTNATLTVTEEGTFTQYQVHVALSADPASSSSLESYEPDYDLLYTFSFEYAAKGKVIHKCVKWDQSSAVLDFSDEYLSNLGVTLDDLEDKHLIKWYIVPSEGGDAIAVSANSYTAQVSDKFNFVFTGGGNDGFPFKMVDSDKYLYYYEGHRDVWKSSFAQEYNDFKLSQVTLYAPSGKTFEDYKDYQVICVTSAENPTVSGADPAEDKLVTYVFHFNADGYSATSANLTTGMTITRDHNMTATAELDLATSDNFSSVNAKFYNHLNDGSTLPKLYMRWYLADKDGHVVPMPEGIKLSPKTGVGYADKVIDGKNYGKVLHLGNAGTVVTADMLKMDVEVTNGSIDLNDYQVVCALGYADDGYTTEPSPLRVKYIYHFESSFEGRLASDAITHTKEVVVYSADKTNGYVVIPINDYFSEILTDLSTTAEDLGKSLHMRWYVMHGDNRYVRSDLQLQAVDGTVGYKVHAGVSDAAHQTYGSLYWNTATCGMADPDLKGKLNVRFTKPTVDDLWENFKVIAVLTNDISVSNGQEVEGDELIKEPQELKVQYIFSMIESEFKFVHHKGAAGRDYFTHDDDVNITAQAGNYTMTKTTVFRPSAINAIGARGDGFFISDSYTLGSSKQSEIDPVTGTYLSKDSETDLYPKFGGFTVKKDNPLKTAIFKIKGVNSVKAYLTSTNKTESRTCYAKATPSDGSPTVTDSDTSEGEGHTAVITLTLDPTKEYVVDFSDSRKTKDDSGADMSLLGVHFNIYGTESVLYAPTEVPQYSWNNDNSKVDVAERNDIRQAVHTVDYNVFINPSENSKMLRLPFQYYDGGGNPLEPMAYIRWYDWTTDLSSAHLNKVGTWLDNNFIDEAGDRGLFMLNNSKPNLTPSHAKVGVTYNPSELTEAGDIIACDVSKYYDGLYPGSTDDNRPEFSGLKYPHFVHEPTLSTRYLFHVYPSSVIVRDIKEGNDRFASSFSGLTSENFSERKKTMFNLYENNGRVIVSLNDNTGDFAVRAQLQTIGEYYVSDGTPTGVKCSQIRWASYLEDENGLWLRTGNLTAKEAIGRIYKFELSKLDGTYTHLTGSLGSKEVTAKSGMRFHIIGYAGNGSYEAATIHYELQFLDAPAILAEKLATTNVKRTTEYLSRHFRQGGIVNFDKYFDDLSEPTTEAQNMLDAPLAWKEAQYGFCYPSIDKYRIRTGYSGLTPIHGQINDSHILYDYTHLVDNSKYGGYIYVDASDESRTIATLDFSASLCSGSQIYFTAAIADVTEGGKTSPQLMAHVYAKNEFGEKTLVMSFLTCVLNTVSNGGYEYNKWYQVYGHGNIPENIDITNFTDFTVEIDNYSKDTEGADFCVDQIVFYTSTGKMQVEQTGGLCEGADLTVTAYMEAEQLENMVTLSDTPKTLYYKIFRITDRDENGTISYEPYNVASVYENDENIYGKIEVPKYELDASGKLTDNTGNANYEIRKNGILYFKLLSNKVLNLPQGYNYFIALTKDLDSPDLTKLADNSQWADPNNACDVYSNFFVPRKTFIHFLALDGDHEVVSQTIQGGCGSTNVHVKYYIQANYPDENEPTGFKALPYGTDGSLTDDGVLFDYFLGTKDELTQDYTGYTMSLLTALQEYRKHERTESSITKYSTELQNYSGLDTDYHSILNDAIVNGKLLLLKASSKFEYDITGTTSFWAIPVNKTYTFGSTDYDICEYIPFTFTVKENTGGPELTLGFDDVDYTAAGTKRVLRVGLEQLNKMRRTTDPYILHVPVNMFKDKYGKTEGKVYFPKDSYLTISAVDKTASPAVPNTTDPTLPAVGTKFAKIVPIDAETRPWVDKNHMYLALDLSGSNCAIDFHEGYQYEVGTIFYDAEDEGVSGACIGDLFLVIKVVPEFVTWKAQNVDDNGNPTTTATSYWSANWYNDGNWHRSTCEELYKGTGQNTATIGHPDGYKNNTAIDSRLTTNPGFVPMKFTYVTLPTGNHAPSLINEPRVVGTGKGARRQGGGFLDLTRTTLLTDRSPNANTDGMSLSERHNSKPTENIYYDMLVRYGEYKTGYDPEKHFGEGCFGHRYQKPDGTWDNQGVQDLTAKVFDVEKFQGNVCREIYFKPGAELLRPHRLQYEKAWVEMELDANKWYLVSVPMKNTYAGDMYVPTSMKSVADEKVVSGRQVTEAFQPITFNTTTYSRTRYPIYQRSWGMNNGTVHVKQNDIRVNSYSANLNYSTVITNMAEWGHTFNDVQVPYNTLTAFAIRAHKKNQTDKTLIRLPKADTSYDYYDWTGTSSTPAAGAGIKTVSKTDIYKLVSDYQDDTDTETTPLEFNISDMQQQGDYVLVGNPFMVSLDMKKFFDYNTALSKDVAHTVPTTEKTTVIKPLQAFFVKKGTATKVTFNKEMQIDGNFPKPPVGSPSGSARRLFFSAACDRGSSMATVVKSDKASADFASGEDVETLFDSNLADVPMVYTVAGGQAVSINQMPELSAVSFGVTCSSDEAVEVTLSGLDVVGDSAFVFDALTGEVTEVGEGSTYAVQPNDYGRYYLTSTRPSPLAGQSPTNSLVVSVRGQQVTVRTADENIGSVRVSDLNGQTVLSLTDCGSSCQFQLSRGVYVIDVQCASERKTVKVIVECRL